MNLVTYKAELRNESSNTYFGFRAQPNFSMENINEPINY